MQITLHGDLLQAPSLQLISNPAPKLPTNLWLNPLCMLRNLNVRSIKLVHIHSERWMVRVWQREKPGYKHPSIFPFPLAVHVHNVYSATPHARKHGAVRNMRQKRIGVPVRVPETHRNQVVVVIFSYVIFSEE
jgi:hypothetical protein